MRVLMERYVKGFALLILFFTMTAQIPNRYDNVYYEFINCQLF